MFMRPSKPATLHILQLLHICSALCECLIPCRHGKSPEMAMTCQLPYITSAREWVHVHVLVLKFCQTNVQHVVTVCLHCVCCGLNGSSGRTCAGYLQSASTPSRSRSSLMCMLWDWQCGRYSPWALRRHLRVYQKPMWGLWHTAVL